jgi:hypothetical protein
MRRPVVISLAVILLVYFSVVAAQWGWDRYQSTPAKSPDPTDKIAAAGTGTTAAHKTNLWWVLYNAPSLPPAKYAPEDLAKIFPAFVHRPFDSAGFNAVMLPFSFSDPEHLGSENEATALTALISDDLDWAPGCYCARHAYFVFKRERFAIARLMQGYDPTQIASLIRRWHATHAVGGELIRTADGYSGKLQIFDAQGSQIFNQTYDVPRSYWDLLGDMDADAMACLDVKPSQQLSDFLHEPRCKQFQLVVDLGSAAFLEEKSPEEFALYQKILAADPDFSMVRHWYANQKHWADGDDHAWATQNGMALASRLEPASLEEFVPALCDDPALALKLPYWLAKAEELVSPDSPLVLERRLRDKMFALDTPEQVIERGLKAAAAYPNSHDLLCYLARETPDRFMAASLMAASLQDRYMPGVSDKENQLANLALNCDQIERNDVAVELLQSPQLQQDPQNRQFLLTALSRSGLYAQAMDVYPQLPADSAPDAVNRQYMAPWAFFAAFMGFKSDPVIQVQHQEAQALAARHLTEMCQLYVNAFLGKDYTTPQSCDPEIRGLFELLLRANDDCCNGTSTYHYQILEYLVGWPMERLLWITEDFYERFDPSNDAANFYEYLSMLFPYDPFVTKAVADFHQRGGSERPVDPAALRDDLHQALQRSTTVNFGDVDWKHEPTPWRVAACVDQLLNQQKPSDATDLANLFYDYESRTENSPAISIAAELKRRATAAQ